MPDMTANPHFSEDILEAAQTYCNLMASLKRRIDALRRMLTLPFFDSIPQNIALESCYLQMRLITELIARACLVIHSGVPGANSKWFRKAVHADEIMDALAGLHPEFYPIPEKPVEEEDGKWKGGLVLAHGFITRSS